MKVKNGGPRGRKGVRASAVRKNPRTTQGWRPHSVTSHPASMAMSPSGLAATIAHSTGLALGTSRRRRNSTTSTSASAAMATPVAYHQLKSEVGGCHRRPLVARKVLESADHPVGVAVDRNDRPPGISIA